MDSLRSHGAVCEWSAVIPVAASEVWRLVQDVDLSQLMPSEVAACRPGSRSKPPNAVGALRVATLRQEDGGTEAGASMIVKLTRVSLVEKAVTWRVTRVPADDAAARAAALVLGRVDDLAVTEVTRTELDAGASTDLDGPGNADRPKASLVQWRTALPAGADSAACRSQHARGVAALRRLLGVGEPTQLRLFDTSPEALAWRTESSPNTAAVCLDADASADENLAQVLDVATNTFAPKRWADVQRGDIVRVAGGEHAPADIMMLWSSSPVQTPVSLKLFDGEDNLRLRKPVDASALDRPMRSAGGDATAGDVTDTDASQESMMVACAVCTVLNPRMVDCCTVCATPLATGGDGGAKKPLELLGKGLEDAGGPADVIGNGSIFDVLRDAGTFTIPRPRVDGKFEARFAPSDGGEKTKTNHQQLVPRWGKLIFVEAMVGIVVHTGADTLWALSGGAAAAAVATVETKRKEAQDEALKTATEARRAARLAMPVDPTVLEGATGILWSNKFTNVPDDGNCGMHAFWLGLKTLLKFYPHLRLENEPEIADSAAAFRQQALDRLEAHEGYQSLLDAMLRLWLSLDTHVLASSVEDFYTLPSSFQELFLAANKQAHVTGTEGLNLESLRRAYVAMMRECHEVGEGDRRRMSYVPLGEIELSALCDLYKVRLQAIKSEDIVVDKKKKKKNGQQSAGGPIGPTLETLDPRCIRPEHVLDRFAPADANRFVRVLNVNTNHYQVHLPRPPPA